MPALPIRFEVSGVEQQLRGYEGLGHLRVRARGEVLTLESGPEADPVHHARLRRATVHLWTLEMAVRGGRWEKTPFRATKAELIKLLVEQFGWALTDWAEPGTD